MPKKISASRDFSDVESAKKLKILASYLLCQSREKSSATIVFAPRTEELGGSAIYANLVDPEENRGVERKDIPKFQRVLDAMESNRPHELKPLKVLSGPVSSKELWGNLDKYDYKYKYLGLDERSAKNLKRDIKDYYRSYTRDEMMHMPDTYHRFPHAVVQNLASPGILIHEAGHAIDLFGGPSEEEERAAANRLLFFNPLPSEFAAWREGKDSVQKGYAAALKGGLKDYTPGEYDEIMRSYHRTRYPALGSYLGGTIGPVAGLGAGLALSYAMARARGFHGLVAPFRLGASGMALGNFLGPFTGLGIGSLWSRLNRKRYARRSAKELERLQKENPEQLEKVIESLRKIRDARGKKNKNKVES
jgi:hypothetical protein